MLIGELAARSGLAPSQIRFYETNGLLAGTKRRTNGYRDFNPRVLQILDVIRSAQQAGFSLDEIRPLLPTGPNMANWNRDKMLASLRQKVIAIELERKRIAKHKATLLAVIDLVENRPEDVDCLANLRRVAAVLRK
jgi:DNA-binding transcriptional MerR regulator